jgi:uncharacterized protein YdaU (DUF1376 family)
MTPTPFSARKRLSGPLPFYKFLVLDYRASRRANKLHYIARGFYRELIDECWLEGGIPNDLDELAEICRCPIEVMREHWTDLRKMFTECSAIDALLSHHRLEDQRTEVDSARLKRVRAGRLGGKAKSSKRKQTQASASTCEAKNTSRSSSSSSSTSKSSSTRQPPLSREPLKKLTDLLPPSFRPAGEGAAGEGEKAAS